MGHQRLRSGVCGVYGRRWSVCRRLREEERFLDWDGNFRGFFPRGSGAWVIASRVLQELGAALLWPAMIGMACAAVGEANRGFALGLIFGTCSLGNAAGPVVGVPSPNGFLGDGSLG